MKAHKRSRLRLLAILTALLVGLAACADDEDVADVDDDEEPAGEEEPETDDPTEDVADDPDDAVAEFYEGETIEVIVGLSTGGSFDVLARLMAEHMPRHIPGNPNMIVENMTGAGSMSAANHVFNVADDDGTVIGTFLGSLINQEALLNPGVEYAMSDFQWLFAGGANRGVCIARTDSGVTTLEDSIDGTQVTLGYTGPGSPGFDYGQFFREVMGANVELVGGYDGNAEVRLAVERGEIDGYCVVYETAIAEHADWEDAGEPEFEYFVHLALEPMEEVPNATFAYELLEDEDERQIFELMVAQNEVFWPFAVPPGVPEERVEALRQAAQDTFDDPEFQAAVEASGLIVNPRPGEEVQEFMDAIGETPEPVLEQFRELLGE